MATLFEVFKAGKHTDSKGSVKTWTNKDLKTIASKYNESDHEAPLVIGHPKTDDPAFGWVDKLVVKGNTLFAQAKDVVKEFQEAFDKKMYKKRSIALYGDMTLKHIGFLGAMPPAIKGLKDFQGFSEEKEEDAFFFETGEESDTFEFADYETTWSFNTIGRLLRGMREDMISKEEIEAADRALPNYAIANLEGMKADSEKALNNFNENLNPKQESETMTPEELKKMNDLETANSAFSEEIDGLKADVKAQTERASKAEGEIKEFKEGEDRKEIEAFCDELVKDAKLTAEAKPQAIQMLFMAKQTDSEFEFAEGDKTAKASSFESMKKLFSGAGASVTFGEKATNEVADDQKTYGSKELKTYSENGSIDPEKAAEFEKIEQYAAKNNCSFAEATSVVMDEN